MSVRPSRTRPPRPAASRPRGVVGAERALPIAGLILLGACSQTGDFGRPAPTAWNTLIDATGSIAAGLRDEPVSDFPYTDDEAELRNRAWRYLMPAKDRGLFDKALANLTRARVLPAAWRASDETGYHDALLAGAFRSPASRYRRLGEDMVADGRLVPAFAATAVRVVAADAVRLKSLAFVDVVKDSEVREAALRVAENRCLIAWVRHELAARALAYRYALQHLVIEAPQLDAVGPERAMTFLEARRGILDDVLPPGAEARCGLEPLAAATPVVAAPLVTK